MPLYDYSCPCGCIGKLITRPNEIPNCPECGKKMNREVHRPFFIDMDPEKGKGIGRKMKRVRQGS